MSFFTKSKNLQAKHPKIALTKYNFSCRYCIGVLVDSLVCWLHNYAKK